MPQRVQHPGVRVQHDLAGRVVDQADRQRHGQLPAARLEQLPAAEPGLDEVQFGLAYGALQADQESVVELAGVVRPSSSQINVPLAYGPKSGASAYSWQLVDRCLYRGEYFVAILVVQQ